MKGLLIGACLLWLPVAILWLVFGSIALFPIACLAIGGVLIGYLGLTEDAYDHYYLKERHRG